MTRGKTAIVGAATYGIGRCPGHSSLEMASRAALMALDDAAIPLGDVDGLFICLPDDIFAGLTLAEYLGIRPKFTDCNRTGGSAPVSHLVTATSLLEAGEIDVAVLAYGSNQLSVGGALSTPARPSAYETPYKPLFPASGYALAAARHMHEFGTTREQFAAVAVAARRWANTNPEAFSKGELTINDCLNSRMISEPLSKSDFCLVTDGAAAIVLTRADRARDTRHEPIAVLGAAAAT